MKRWFTTAEILKMATKTNAELLAMSEPRNPYPGQLGVVADPGRVLAELDPDRGGLGIRGHGDVERLRRREAAAVVDRDVGVARMVRAAAS